jgi:hypothetical protein
LSSLVVAAAVLLVETNREDFSAQAVAAVVVEPSTRRSSRSFQAKQ